MGVGGRCFHRPAMFVPQKRWHLYSQFAESPSKCSSWRHGWHCLRFPERLLFAWQHIWFLFPHLPQHPWSSQWSRYLGRFKIHQPQARPSSNPLKSLNFIMNFRSMDLIFNILLLKETLLACLNLCKRRILHLILQKDGIISLSSVSGRIMHSWEWGDQS